MFQKRPIISLGDLIRAFTDLRPNDDNTRQLIIELLGLQWHEGSTLRPNPLEVEQYSPLQSNEEQPDPGKSTLPLPLEPESPSPLPGNEEQPDPGKSTSPAKPSGPAQLPTSSSSSSDWIPSTLEVAQSQEETWSIDALPLSPEKEEELYGLPALEPLFKPEWTRGILSAALSTVSGDGPLNVPGVVEMLAQGRYIERIPRLPWPTLRRGVQLLVDGSDSMVPFMRDQVWLRHKIQEVVGVDKVWIHRFIGSPLQVSQYHLEQASATYCLPRPGTVVLLLSDLSIGRPLFSTYLANLEEWVEFAGLIRRACCPLVALVPYAPSRWPRRLCDEMTLIQWDRGTSVATVRRLVGYAHEVAE